MTTVWLGANAQPDREALAIDNRVDFGREPTLGTIGTLISIPIFAVAACWCARMEVLSIICMSLSCVAVVAPLSSGGHSWRLPLPVNISNRCALLLQDHRTGLS